MRQYRPLAQCCCIALAIVHAPVQYSCVILSKVKVMVKVEKRNDYYYGSMIL